MNVSLSFLVGCLMGLFLVAIGMPVASAIMNWWSRRETPAKKAAREKSAQVLDAMQKSYGAVKFDKDWTEQYWNLGGWTLCQWPGCDKKALCASGNVGGCLVCEDHFKITNGKAAEELTSQERAIMREMSEKSGR